MQRHRIEESDSPLLQEGKSAWRIAFLTNFIPPYHKPLYTLLSQHYSQFRLLLSTPMETNRPWSPEWDGLDVIVQKGLTLRRRWKHPVGFEEPLAVHFPADTIPQLTRFRPDAVISAEMGFRTFLAWLYTRLRADCRLLIWTEVNVTTEHGRGQSRLLLRRFLARRAHAFLSLGDGGVRYIQSLGVERSRIFKIEYSTNLAPFLALPVDRYSEAAKRLLFSGQLVARKGLQPFLEGLTRWASRNPQRTVEFHVLGDGPIRDSLETFAMPANVKLIFIGTVEYSQLPAIYAESGILVLPTLADTWAVVVNEAMSSGLPVLGSLSSGAVEAMVENGVSGWTFRPDRPAELDDALDRALSATENQLNQMRANARRRALSVRPEHTAAAVNAAVTFALEQH